MLWCVPCAESRGPSSKVAKDSVVRWGASFSLELTAMTCWGRGDHGCETRVILVALSRYRETRVSLPGITQ